VKSFTQFVGIHGKGRAAFPANPVGLHNASDQVRPVATQTIEQFRNLGIHELVILSGDHENAVRRVADSVGIGEVHAKLNPHDNISRLPWLLRLSKRMLKIININVAFGRLFNAAAISASGAG
jgi:cation transport ATPase